MESLIQCPICREGDFRQYIKCKDYTVSQDNFEIVTCVSCNFKFTNPRPRKEHLGNYYKSQEYISHSNTSKGIVNKLYQFIRKYTLIKKLQLIESALRAKEKTLLDIGCGTGEFLSICKAAKWTSIGIEPSDSARTFAENTYGLNVYDEGALDQMKEESFSIITMWHVLEHVSDLEKRVLEVKKLLKKNGKLIIAVPNLNSLDAKIYGQYWAAYDVPRHLYHFAPGDIERLFGQHGMKLDSVFPMVFDSFYVSMLSEKYKSGKLNIIRAFWNGLKSNISAINKTNTYSSQIYIISKME